MKPFNLNEAKQGKPVCTKDGHSVRILCFDMKGTTFPIIGLITRSFGKNIIYEDLKTFNNIGVCNTSSYRDEDVLMMLD